MEYKVKILSIKKVTHNVRSYRVEKPAGYSYKPGQATDLSVNKPGWENEVRPFTFTSLTSNPFLEFTIKSYYDHNGVTNELSKLKPDDELILRDVWGAIEYKGEGYFIAGGAGVTPFIAIFRQLEKENKLEDNKLFFSNKTSGDIILKEEFEKMLGENFINTLTRSKENGYNQGLINEEFLKKNVSDFKRHFYLCGPPPMIEALQTTLSKLGASPDSVVFEK
jgi:ferredoxin-NADP reductase